MKPEEIEQLTARYLDGELDEDGIAVLVKEFTANSDLGRDAARLFVIERLLQMKMTGSESHEFTAETIERLKSARTDVTFTAGVIGRIRDTAETAPSSWPFRALIALAAGIVLVLGAWFILPHKGRHGGASPADAVALVATTPGNTVLRRNTSIPATGNMTFTDGDVLCVPQGGKAVLAFRNESTTIDVASESNIRLKFENGSKSIHLEKGALTCDVAKHAPGKPAIFLTEQARVEVLGTRFALSSDAAWTKLDMSEGTARMTSLTNDMTADVPSPKRGVVLQAMPGERPAEGPFVGEAITAPPDTDRYRAIVQWSDDWAGITKINGVSVKDPEQDIRITGLQGSMLDVVIKDIRTGMNVSTATCVPRNTIHAPTTNDSILVMHSTYLGKMKWQGQPAVVMVDFDSNVLSLKSDHRAVRRNILVGVSVRTSDGQDLRIQKGGPAQIKSNETRGGK